jgi:hypothetical protein
MQKRSKNTLFVPSFQKNLYLYRVKLFIVVNKNDIQMIKRVSILLCCLGLLVFRVQAQQANTTSSVTTQQVDNSVKVTYIDTYIKVENAPAKSSLEIYNIVGSKVKVIEMIQSSGEYPVSLPKGYYIVRIDGGIVRKIVVR